MFFYDSFLSLFFALSYLITLTYIDSIRNHFAIIYFELASFLSCWISDFYVNQGLLFCLWIFIFCSLVLQCLNLWWLFHYFSWIFSHFLIFLYFISTINTKYNTIVRRELGSRFSHLNSCMPEDSLYPEFYEILDLPDHNQTRINKWRRRTLRLIQRSRVNKVPDSSLIKEIFMCYFYCNY